MKVSLFLVIFSICLTACSGVPHPRAVPKQIESSVVLISSAAGKICGTGLLLQSTLLTSAHLAAALCPYGACVQAQVKSSTLADPDHFVSISVSKLEIESLSFVEDLARLRVNDGTLDHKFTPAVGAKPEPGAALYMLGFPGCSSMALSQGTLLGLNPMQLLLSAQGKRGSSGSPVFDRHFKLVGIAGQSLSAWDGLKSALFGGTFKMKATAVDGPPDSIGSIQQDAPERLLRFYAEEVSSQRGLSRLFHGLEYMSLLEKLRRDMLKDPDSSRAWPFMYLDDYPSNLLLIDSARWRGASERDLTLLRLISAYNLEYYGPRLNLTARVSLPDLSAALKAKEAPQAFQELLQQAVQNIEHAKYPGLQFMLLRLAFYACVFSILALVGIGWAWRRFRRLNLSSKS
jgi:hypothetical protein